MRVYTDLSVDPDDAKYIEEQSKQEKCEPYELVARMVKAYKEAKNEDK
ncbi:MAG: hypothetical protein OXC18_02865 [Desulfurellaceae bacterium]|nr:hypothetical protein [Desulfurellaceae bacterium]